MVIDMFERLREVEDKYEELGQRLADPNVWSDQKEYQRLAKAHSGLSDLVVNYREYKRVHQERLDTEELLHGRLEDEMREMAQAELDQLKERESDLEHELEIMLLPKDPNDE